MERLVNFRQLFKLKWGSKKLSTQSTDIFNQPDVRKLTQFDSNFEFHHPDHSFGFGIPKVSSDTIFRGISNAHFFNVLNNSSAYLPQSQRLHNYCCHHDPNQFNFKLNRINQRTISLQGYQQHRYYQQNDRQQNNEDDKDPEKDKEEFLRQRLFMIMIFVGSALSFLFVKPPQNPSGSTEKRLITWTEFTKDMLSKGEVEEITLRGKGQTGHQVVIRLVEGATIRGYKVQPGETFVLYTDDIDKFEMKVRAFEKELGIKPEHGVAFNYDLRSRGEVFTALATVVIISAIILLMTRKTSLLQFPDMFGSVRKAKFVRVDLQTVQGKGITFKDVAGLKEPKVEIMEFVDYLKRPDKYTTLGGRIPHGALLTGPPGCGKTLLAKALATEAKVPFLAMAGSEFVEMIGGLGAARVRDLFKEARERSPCIIYIDEVDGIGRKRQGDNWSTATEEEHTLNQLLVEMDGMDTTPGVIVIASTNRAEVLDQALLRPGRFDRHILIDLPTLAEREEIFDIYLRKLALKQPASSYIERLSQLSPGMSGADIANICNEAALYAARYKKHSVDVEDFEYAVERVVAGVAKKSRVLSPKEKKVVAYHEAGHALVGWLLQYTDPLLKVSIVPRANNTLGFAQYMPQDRKLYAKQELFERMCMALGGRVAEAVVFNSVTSGAQDDLQRVTKMAYGQVRNWGFSDVIGHVSFPEDESPYSVKPFSKKLSSMIDEESKRMVAKAYQHTETIINDNKDKLKLIAEALLEREVLNFSDVQELIGDPPHEKKMVTAKW